jgi:hypothetical protein
MPEGMPITTAAKAKGTRIADKRAESRDRDRRTAIRAPPRNSRLCGERKYRSKIWSGEAGLQRIRMAQATPIMAAVRRPRKIHPANKE